MPAAQKASRRIAAIIGAAYQEQAQPQKLGVATRIENCKKKNGSVSAQPWRKQRQSEKRQQRRGSGAGGAEEKPVMVMK
jgi:hypothetical protein